MLTLHDWQAAVSTVADELRCASQVFSPPVDAIELARAARLLVAVDRAQSGRGRIKRIGGRATIFLRPEERPERLQWAAAHELGESQIGRICRSLGLAPNDLCSREREDLSNCFAREILLPIDWFRRDCRALGNDLIQLKRRYATASHELIAWRWLDLDRPAIVSVFDQGGLSRRRGNGTARTPGLAEIEQRCWMRLRRARESCRLADDRMDVRGWCIDASGWEREILYTVVAED